MDTEKRHFASKPTSNAIRRFPRVKQGFRMSCEWILKNVISYQNKLKTQYSTFLKLKTRFWSV